MKYRKLRIAWSAGWGVVAVLLCALWVRSYWLSDTIFCMKHSSGTSWFGGTYESDSSSTTVTSEIGFIKLCWQEWPDFVNDWWDFDAETTDRKFIEKLDLGLLGLRTETTWYGRLFAVSDRTLLFATTILAVAPWISYFRWRFSLRALFIATTLIAVVLGILIYATRG